MIAQEMGADFVVYGEGGRVVLLVESRGRTGTTALWAAQYRHNRLAHDILPSAPFFLVAAQDYLYLWIQSDQQSTDALPEFTVDAAQELKPYFDKLSLSPGEMWPDTFKLLLLWWLGDLAALSRHHASQAPVGWLSESGLFEALAKARIEVNSAT